MNTNSIGTSASQQQFFSQTRTSPATFLGPTERKTLSLRVLARTEPITHLARNYNVSRKFIYQQAATARQALDSTFQPSPRDKNVIFHLPVTKEWIRQFVLSQVLIGHSSFRAVLGILNAVFDYRDISIGTIHNIVTDAVQKAKLINQKQPLTNCIFWGNRSRTSCEVHVRFSEGPKVKFPRSTHPRKLRCFLALKWR